MGSQSRPNAWLKTKLDDRRNVEDFSDYIRKMTPPGLVHERRALPTLPRDKDDTREAMRFFSESHMR